MTEFHKIFRDINPLKSYLKLKKLILRLDLLEAPHISVIVRTTANMFQSNNADRNFLRIPILNQRLTRSRFAHMIIIPIN